MNKFDLAEPTKEQEQVIDANMHAMEVALRNAVLAERWQPTGASVASRALQIGIEMGPIVCGDAPTSEVRDNMGDVESAGPQLAAANLRR